MNDLLIDGEKSSGRTIVLAHGAGAPMNTPFMNTIARGLAARGHRVVRFEFDYMRARHTGKRPGPDRPAALEKRWRDVIDHLGGGPSLVIGGKSLGGRFASMVADEAAAGGLVCLGYPFHPPGKPERLRVAHLANLRTPALIIQGMRDPFGGPDEVGAYDLSDQIRVAWIADGDHSLSPRVSSGRTKDQNLTEAIDRIAAFVEKLDAE